MIRTVAIVLALVAAALAAAVPGARATAAGGLPVAHDGRVAGDGEKTRFVLDLSGEIAVRAFTLADPYRVVVDLPEVEFRLPADAGLTGRGLVSGWRFGLFARGRSRIVLDAAGPVSVEDAFVVPPADGQPARLVVDLARTTPEAFRTDLLETAATRAAANDVPVTKSDRLDRPADGERLPLVVLDPGHGGVDAGTTSPDGVAEKDLVLAFATDLRARLEATGKVEVRMTREDDTFVALGERVRIARTAGANLFVSIHADSVKEDFVRGATVYTLSERASDAGAAALAIKENAADAVAGLDDPEEMDEVADILVDLTRRETKTFSMAFADGLVRELSTTTRMIRNPHRSAGFSVLRAPDVPSVLVEVGYLSNADDAKLLSTDDFREKMSGAIADAILGFFRRQMAASAG